MKPDRATQRADALLRLEHTRMQWVLRTAHSAQRAGGAANGEASELSGGGPLNAILSEWLASEIEARLWPDATDGEPGAPGEDTDDTQAPHRPPPPSQVLSQTLAEWTSHHPWLGVLAGLLAGSLAVSQRKRLLQWTISAALPWLASHAAVLAVPLLAQWLLRQSEQQPMAATPADHEDPSSPPESSSASSPASSSASAPASTPASTPTGGSPPADEDAPRGDLSESRSAAAGSPG